MNNPNEENPVAQTSIICGVVLEQDGKYLLVQEKQPKFYKKWHLPAGRVDEGETLEQAAVREAKEECGYDVELESHVFTQQVVVESPVLHAYKATIVGGELAFPEDEILDARWFSYEDSLSNKVELRSPDYILGAIDAARKA